MTKLRTKTEFLEQFHPLLLDLVTKAFLDADKGRDQRGNYCYIAVNSVRPLLERMHDYITDSPPPVKAPEPLSMNDQVNALVARIGKLDESQAKVVKDALVKKLTTREANGKP